MNNKKESLKEWIASLSTDSLKRIIDVDFNDYESYAIEMAKEELSRRADDIDSNTPFSNGLDDTDGTMEVEESEKDLERIRKHIASLSDEELINIVEVNYKEYRKSAIKIVREEIKKRKLVIKPHFDTFRDLIKKVEFESVAETIKNIYPEQFSLIEKYEEVFNTLLEMKPSESNNDYISIEPYNYYWNVVGMDANTDEKFGVEFYAWSDWLSFHVKDEQIYKIGKEKYIAICLVILTQYGFSEEEIQRSFVRMEIVNLSQSDEDDSNSNGQPILQNREITLDRMIERTAIVKDELKEMNEEVIENTESLETRPWIRYWARMIDSSLWGIIIWIVGMIAFPRLYKLGTRFAFGYVSSIVIFLLWSLVEAYLLSKWGYTPGKWILNTKVRGLKGAKLSYQKALKRVLFLLFYGEGLLIPFVSFITNIAAYSRLTDRGITKWDEMEEVVVTHEEVAWYRVLLAVLIIVGIPLILFMINRRYKF